MIINLLYEHILKKYRISIEQYFILECLNLKLYDIINKKRYVLDIQNLFRRKFIDTLSDNENLDIENYTAFGNLFDHDQHGKTYKNSDHLCELW